MTTERFHADLMANIPAGWHLHPEHLSLHNNIDIVKTCGLLDPKELSILEHDATDLVRLLGTRQLTALEVTTLYLKAAAVAHQAVNCLFDFFPEEALERARWLGNQLSSTIQVVGPLHGLPISIKGERSCPGPGFINLWRNRGARRLTSRFDRNQRTSNDCRHPQVRWQGHCRRRLPTRQHSEKQGLVEMHQRGLISAISATRGSGTVHPLKNVRFQRPTRPACSRNFSVCRGQSRPGGKDRPILAFPSHLSTLS